jgi:hypothetical protein
LRTSIEAEFEKHNLAEQHDFRVNALRWTSLSDLATSLATDDNYMREFLEWLDSGDRHLVYVARYLEDEAADNAKGGSRISDCQLSATDFLRLRECRWLNDSLMDAALNSICKLSAGRGTRSVLSWPNPDKPRRSDHILQRKQAVLQQSSTYTRDGRENDSVTLASLHSSGRWNSLLRAILLREPDAVNTAKLAKLLQLSVIFAGNCDKATETAMGITDNKPQPQHSATECTSTGGLYGPYLRSRPSAPIPAKNGPAPTPGQYLPTQSTSAKRRLPNHDSAPHLHPRS